MPANTNRSGGAQTPAASRESTESQESQESTQSEESNEAEERTSSEEPTLSPEPTDSELLTSMINIATNITHHQAHIEIYDQTISYYERRQAMNTLIDFFNHNDRSFTHMQIAELSIFVAEHGGVVGLDTGMRQVWIRICLDACNDGFEDSDELNAKARELDQVLEVQADRVMVDEGDELDDGDDDGEDSQKEYEERDDEDDDDGRRDDDEEEEMYY
ncbi:hypothetical protein LZ554_004564 [Drepanopeziza brunnea f. sp. 'monogermtubi']|nr:hypothetical protein LZ554_004564 [Drepanopeziza brunnea f. sp. 'monogermtubi']